MSEWASATATSATLDVYETCYQNSLSFSYMKQDIVDAYMLNTLASY